MIISKSKRFVFSDVPKTGSISMEHALTKYEDAYITVHDKKHTPFGVVGHLLLPYFKFCFFRNPWDQFVSLYRYRKERGAKVGDFDEWIETATFCFEYADIESEYGFILDRHGFVIPEIKVYKYEEIYKSWGDICKRLDIPDKLPHHNKSRHPHYSTYYTNKTRHIIARRCWREIEMMEYEYKESR